MNEEQQPGNRDAMVSRLYREAAGETPPPSLDSAVLQRARAAVKDTPARASRWSWGGWQARFAVLATVVISFTVLLISQQAGQEPPGMDERVSEPMSHIKALRDNGNSQAVRPQATPASPAPSQEKPQPGRATDGAGTPAAALATAPAPAKAAEAMPKVVVPAPSEPARPAQPSAAPSVPAAPPALAQPAPPTAPAAESVRALQRSSEPEGRARDAGPATAARAGASANSSAERVAPAQPLDE